MRQVTIYTDGACFGNPGPGGWAALLICDSKERVESGAEQYTTNNQMELLAVISALQVLKERCKVQIYTDSKYVKNGITVWIKNWQRKNWRTASGTQVKNKQLWQQLNELTKQHEISWHWVKAHNGDPYNERVDSLAKSAIEKLQQDS